MGGRCEPLAERTKDRIRAVALIDRLQAFSLEELDPRTQKRVEMNNAQVRAALGLINKVLPDVKAVELSGPDGAAIPLNGVVKFIGGKLSSDPEPG